MEKCSVSRPDPSDDHCHREVTTVAESSRSVRGSEDHSVHGLALKTESSLAGRTSCRHCPCPHCWLRMGRCRGERSDVAGKEQRHPWKSAVGSPPEPLLTSPTGQPDAFCRPLRPVARFRAKSVRGSNLYAQIYESRCWLNELPQTNEPTDSLYLTFMWLSQEPA